VNLYQKEYDKLQTASDSSVASNEVEKVATPKKRKHQMSSRPQVWNVDSDVYHQSTSNVSIHEDEFETVSCMKSNTCFVSGVTRTEGGHYRVDNSEMFALVTSSDGG
jgi:hypothetical protein